MQRERARGAASQGRSAPAFRFPAWKKLEMSPGRPREGHPGRDTQGGTPGREPRARPAALTLPAPAAAAGGTPAPAPPPWPDLRRAGGSASSGTAPGAPQRGLAPVSTLSIPSPQFCIDKKSQLTPVLRRAKSGCSRKTCLGRGLGLQWRMDENV